MVAFGNGLDAGASHLETDLHLTADGVVVCFHDSTVDRTTDGAGSVSSFTLGDLRRLDAGFRHRLDGAFPFRNRGMKVPTLGELLATFSDVGVIVDLKVDGLEEPVVDVVSSLDAWDRVIVGSFSDERLARIEDVSRGRAMTSGGPATVLRWWTASRVGMTGPSGPVAFQVPPSMYGLRVIDRRFMDAAHDAGVAIHVWTVNQRSEMDRLWSLGVDAVITDRPDLAGNDLALV